MKPVERVLRLCREIQAMLSSSCALHRQTHSIDDSLEIPPTHTNIPFVPLEATVEPNRATESHKKPETCFVLIVGSPVMLKLFFPVAPLEAWR